MDVIPSLLNLQINEDVQNPTLLNVRIELNIGNLEFNIAT